MLIQPANRDHLWKYPRKWPGAIEVKFLKIGYYSLLWGLKNIKKYPPYSYVYTKHILLKSPWYIFIFKGSEKLLKVAIFHPFIIVNLTTAIFEAKKLAFFGSKIQKYLTRPPLFDV